MKRRTYAILEIWYNYGQEDQRLMHRTEDWDHANQLLLQCFRNAVQGNPRAKFYIIEAQVLVKIEADGEPERAGPPTVRPQDT